MNKWRSRKLIAVGVGTLLGVFLSVIGKFDQVIATFLRDMAFLYLLGNSIKSVTDIFKKG